MATDNGISRFDGKRFINYTTKNGLPSNDVIQVIKQNDGTIWANCYKQPPSYFNDKLNRFICLENNKHVLEISNGLLNVIYSVNKNDLFFHNFLGSFVFKNGKVINKVKYLDLSNNIFELYVKDELISFKSYDSISKNKKYLVSSFFKNNKNLGKIKHEISNLIINVQYNNNSIYRFSNNSITQIKINNLHPFDYKLVIKSVPETIKWYKFSDSKLSITCTNGTILIYDEKTLELLSTIKNEYNVNTAYVDKQNNVWVATLNNGLMYYTNQNIAKEAYSDDVVTNFLCVKVSNNGELFAGNYQGEIYVKNGIKENKYFFDNSVENNLWVRNIHFFPNKTIIVSDNGLNINFNKNLSILNNEKNKLNLKSSAKLNDKILILGSISGLVKFDVDSEIQQPLYFLEQRILNIKRKNDNLFYFSANDGLFLYNLTSNKYQLVISNKMFKNDKIQYFELTENNAIWISTYKGNLYLIDNNKVIKQFINDEQIPINISKLLNLKNKLWIASKAGIYILDYKNLQSISVSKLTTSDGLTSNAINYLDFKNDTIYAASDNGVSKIPCQNFKSDFIVYPKLIEVKVNGKTIELDTDFKLKSEQNNISLELAGVDISGHFKNFQYAINESNYINISGNFLNLKLNNGTSLIKIRAIDENNKIHQNEIKLTFEIQTPFYMTIWFWSLITFVISTLLYMYFNNRKLEKQKTIFQQKLALEEQRNKITADLHDDIGATLSSLQLNSAVATQFITNDVSKTQKLLVKIENQSKELAEKIGDIIWSMKPGEHEFMTLSSRIKNFTSDILGATDCNFKVNIDNEINNLITDFTIRKNIILIAKEAINNCAKYSKAKNVSISIKNKKEYIEMFITDDGIGFDTSIINGNGISNMKRRSVEINSEFSIESNKNSGTKIKVQIPLPYI